MLSKSKEASLDYSNHSQPSLQHNPRNMSVMSKLISALSTWHMSSHTEDGKGSLSTSVGEGEEPRIYLPPVDKFGQREQQKRIMHQQISRNVPSVCAELGVNHHDALPTISALVNTFRYSCKNVCCTSVTMEASQINEYSLQVRQELCHISS